MGHYTNGPGTYVCTHSRYIHHLRELVYNVDRLSKQATGVEPAYLGWKPSALPLSYACAKWTYRDSNPDLRVASAVCSPYHYRPKRFLHNTQM